MVGGNFPMGRSPAPSLRSNNSMNLGEQYVNGMVQRVGQKVWNSLSKLPVTQENINGRIQHLRQFPEFRNMSEDRMRQLVVEILLENRRENQRGNKGAAPKKQNTNININEEVRLLRRVPFLKNLTNDQLKARVLQWRRENQRFRNGSTVQSYHSAPASSLPPSPFASTGTDFVTAGSVPTTVVQLAGGEENKESRFHQDTSPEGRKLREALKRHENSAMNQEHPTAPSLVPNNNNINNNNNNNAENLNKINMRAPRVSNGKIPTNYANPAYTNQFTKYRSKFSQAFIKPSYAYDPNVKYESSNAITRLRYLAHDTVASSLFGHTAQKDICTSRSDSNAAYKFVTNVPQACIQPMANARSFKVKIGGKAVTLRRQVGSNVFAAIANNIPMYARLIPITHEEEVFRMHKLTQMVLCNSVPHFPIMYGAVRCRRNGKTVGKTGPQRARGSREYYLTLTEAFHGTLRQWLATERSPLSYASAIAQLLVALSVLHGRRIRHGGLTPDNVVFFNVMRGKGWWQYRLGDKDIFIRKHESMFALNNFSNSALFGEISSPRLQPHCEVVALLEMFAMGRNVPAIVRTHVRQLIEFAAREKLDAPMFLRSRAVLGTLQNLAGEAVAEETRNTNSYDKFDILPSKYKPYRGVAKCRARSMSGNAHKRWYHMDEWGEPPNLVGMLDPLTNLFLMRRRK